MLLLKLSLTLLHTFWQLYVVEIHLTETLRLWIKDLSNPMESLYVDLESRRSLLVLKDNYDFNNLRF